MSKILVVDDDLAISSLLKFNLEQAGYQVECAYDGVDALEKILTKQYDAVLLDLMLPKKDGMTVLRELREQKNLTPVLLVTAKGEKIDCIIGLEIGADDYVEKPFIVRELLARLKAVLRRAQSKILDNQEQVINHSPQIELIKDAIQVDHQEKVLLVNNQKVSLTPKEYALLKYFLQNKNKVLDRDTILLHVWGFDFSGDSRIVDMQISNLREKLESNPKEPTTIKTIRGFGYLFEVKDNNG